MNKVTRLGIVVKIEIREDRSVCFTYREEGKACQYICFVKGDEVLDRSVIGDAIGKNIQIISGGIGTDIVEATIDGKLVLDRKNKVISPIVS